MKREEVLLELIYISPEEVMSPIQIMKSLFLIEKELKLGLYEFQPYLYGPCSFEVYSDLEYLENKIMISSLPTSVGWKYYGVTEEGKRIAKEVEKRLDKKILKKLQEVKTTVVSKSFFELLKYIYEKYPEYAVASIVNIRGFER
ncbi:MAG: hypothetical protein DDT42_01753 [candidate division WS2 bacterium]|uniref:Uncharacterized protein n=1 Tax=Psychracetigena formicireducens TaxID=2986056 RepID=A0A9E2BHV3_PSYF1|nr:hypothetical protein [Candidatus Psychracetigena formicireducens]